MVITTFVWSTYFSTAIVGSTEEGAALWGAALSVAGLVVALLGPALGAIADRAGRRKPWIGGFAFLCVCSTAFLWFSVPHPGVIDQTLLLVVLGNIAYEFGQVFYNAMLRDLAPPALLGRLSGWGWGLGYVGGLGCLIVALFGLIRPATPPFGLDRSLAEPVRATAPLVALWFVVFVIPLFVLTPDRPAEAGEKSIRFWGTVHAGLGSLLANLRRLPREPGLLRFLLARMIYADGLNTLFIFGGLYAAGRFGLKLEEVLLFGIAINATAGAGALLFGWVDDWIGSRPTIILSLLALIALGTGILVTDSRLWFWVLGLALGVFVGPAQAASRTLMARLAPRGLEAEMFGLYALTGKVTAFLGPALYGWATAQFATQRAGMASVVAFLAVGLALLLTVRVPAEAGTSGR